MCSLIQVRRLLFPGWIPGHRFLRSAAHANLSCAVAFDAHKIKTAAIIRMIFTKKALLPSIRFGTATTAAAESSKKIARLSL